MDHRNWPPDQEPPRSEPAGGGRHGWPPQPGGGYAADQGRPDYQQPGYGYPDPAGRRYHRPAPGADRPAVEAPPDGPAWLPALWWTAGCFVVPALVYLAWAATRTGAVVPGCLDPAGEPCPSPRGRALGGLVGAAPGLAVALALALLVAAGLRRMAVSWRASTVGLAAAVIGAGITTLISSLVG